MSRALDRFTFFVGNYFYYRKRGFGLREAWHLAGVTLP